MAAQPLHAADELITSPMHQTPGQPWGSQSHSPAGTRNHRRWLFRGAALLLPLAVLCVLELILRLAHYGYPTHFFIPARFHGSTVLVENPKFGWQFFPPPLARRPIPLMLTPQKPPGTYRIFVFGESATQGHPDPAFSFSRILSVLIEARYPGTKFEVINT